MLRQMSRQQVFLTNRNLLRCHPRHRRPNINHKPKRSRSHSRLLSTSFIIINIRSNPNRRSSLSNTPNTNSIPNTRNPILSKHSFSLNPNHNPSKRNHSLNHNRHKLKPNLNLQTNLKTKTQTPTQQSLKNAVAVVLANPKV